MRYLCLGYYDPETFESPSEAEQAAIGRVCRPHDEALRASGRLVSVASLEHRTAATLQPRNGKTSVADGPSTEAKELAGSCFNIEAEDLDEANPMASLHPAARWVEHLGFAVEVRPIELFQQVQPEAMGRRGDA